VTRRCAFVRHGFVDGSTIWALTFPIVDTSSTNGSGYTADDTRRFAVAIGLKPLTTPVCSPQSNGMAESFVKTMKRDYVAFMLKPDAATAARNLAIAFIYITTRSIPIAR